MDAPSGQAADDFQQAQRCLRGDSAALGALRERHNAALRAILQARGASPTEAEDVLADLWGDCVPGAGDKPVLLEKFSGKCLLQSWLATVASNRWLDKKRRENRGRELLPNQVGQLPELGQRLPEPSTFPGETAIVDLLCESLKVAFASCGDEQLVCLRLVYLHGLSQREISRMMGWDESKVSRTLAGAMQQIATETLREVRKRDAWLTITWEDFLELCQTNQIGFF